jgi:FMN phosphatase YigB (HAD superfamily)
MSAHIENRRIRGFLLDADGTLYDIRTQQLIFEKPRAAIASHLNTTIEKYVALANRMGSFSHAFVKMGGTREDYVHLSEVDKSEFLKHDPRLVAMLTILRTHAKLAILTSTTETSLESIGKTILGPDWEYPQQSRQW